MDSHNTKLERLLFHKNENTNQNEPKQIQYGTMQAKIEQTQKGQPKKEDGSNIAIFLNDSLPCLCVFRHTTMLACGRGHGNHVAMTLWSTTIFAWHVVDSSSDGTITLHLPLHVCMLSADNHCCMACCGQLFRRHNHSSSPTSCVHAEC